MRFFAALPTVIHIFFHSLSGWTSEHSCFRCMLFRQAGHRHFVCFAYRAGFRVTQSSFDLLEYGFISRFHEEDKMRKGASGGDVTQNGQPMFFGSANYSVPVISPRDEHPCRSANISRCRAFFWGGAPQRWSTSMLGAQLKGRPSRRTPFYVPSVHSTLEWLRNVFLFLFHAIAS